MIKTAYFKAKRGEIIFVLEREQIILDYLEEHEIATTSFLCELVGVSISTIRRDLNSMNERGLIIKTHGGAKKIANNKPTATPNLSMFNTRLDNLSIKDDLYINEKKEIAKLASSLILPGDVIFLGSGLTCAFLAKEIKHLSNLTVVTTSIDIVNELAPHIPLILLGGDIVVGKNHIETLGDYTIEILNTMFFDKSFFTVDGIDFEFGYSIKNRKQIPLYDYLTTHCKTSYLLADYSKFNKQTFAHLFDLNGVNNIIVDDKAPKEYLNKFKENNINTYIA